MHSDDAAISPATLELVNLLSDPGSYPAVVDAMPPCPQKTFLQALGYVHRLYPRLDPSRPQWALPQGREVVLVLHVEGAPAIGLTFDRQEPYSPRQTKVTIYEQPAAADPDSFASAVELAAGMLLNYWMQRRAWPAEVRPADERPRD